MKKQKYYNDKEILNNAIKERLNKLLNEYDLTINGLAMKSCLTQSTVDSIFNGRSNNPTVLTISKICEGLNITLKEFFADELFNNINKRK